MRRGVHQRGAHKALAQGTMWDAGACHLLIRMSWLRVVKLPARWKTDQSRSLSGSGPANDSTWRAEGWEERGVQRLAS